MRTDIQVGPAELLSIHRALFIALSNEGTQAISLLHLNSNYWKKSLPPHSCSTSCSYCLFLLLLLYSSEYLVITITWSLMFFWSMYTLLCIIATPDCYIWSISNFYLRVVIESSTGDEGSKHPLSSSKWVQRWLFSLQCAGDSLNWFLVFTVEMRQKLIQR